MEREDERGIAHMVEHLAFRASRSCPEEFKIIKEVTLDQHSVRCDCSCAAQSAPRRLQQPAIQPVSQPFVIFKRAPIVPADGNAMSSGAFAGVPNGFDEEAHCCAIRFLSLCYSWRRTASSSARIRMPTRRSRKPCTSCTCLQTSRSWWREACGCCGSWRSR